MEQEEKLPSQQPLAAPGVPSQWEMMLWLQAAPAGHMFDSIAPSLVLLIQPGGLEFPALSLDTRVSPQAVQLC